ANDPLERLLSGKADSVERLQVEVERPAAELDDVQAHFRQGRFDTSLPTQFAIPANVLPRDHLRQDGHDVFVNTCNLLLEPGRITLEDLAKALDGMLEVIGL